MKVLVKHFSIDLSFFSSNIYFQILFAIIAIVGTSLAAPTKKYPALPQPRYNIQLVDTVLTQDLLPATHEIIYDQRLLPLVDEYIIEDMPVVDLILN